MEVVVYYAKCCANKKRLRIDVLNRLIFKSGYQDSNLGPPAPKAGALTGLRYTPKLFNKLLINIELFFLKSVAKVNSFSFPANFFVTFFMKIIINKATKQIFKSLTLYCSLFN